MGLLYSSCLYQVRTSHPTRKHWRTPCLRRSSGGGARVWPPPQQQHQHQPEERVGPGPLRTLAPSLVSHATGTACPEVVSTRVKLFIGSKVQSWVCYKTSTTDGRGGEMGGRANFRNKAHRSFDQRNNTTPVFHLSNSEHCTSI